MKMLVLMYLFIVGYHLNENKVDHLNRSLLGKGKGSKNTGIEVRFCLLNAQNQESTTFQSGENFTFFLSLKNNSNDSLFLDNSFLSLEDKFCAVYTLDNNLVGQPFSYAGGQIVSSNLLPFSGPQKEFVLKVPWKDSRANWNTLYYNFKGLQQKDLPKGKYYTVFKHRFCFDRKDQRPSLCLEPVNIRIDFEVI